MKTTSFVLLGVSLVSIFASSAAFADAAGGLLSKCAAGSSSDILISANPRTGDHFKFSGDNVWKFRVDSGSQFQLPATKDFAAEKGLCYKAAEPEGMAKEALPDEDQKACLKGRIHDLKKISGAQLHEVFEALMEQYRRRLANFAAVIDKKGRVPAENRAESKGELEITKDAFDACNGYLEISQTDKAQLAERDLVKEQFNRVLKAYGLKATHAVSTDGGPTGRARGAQ